MILHSKIIGKGQPLIILHGLFGMGDNWLNIANQLSESFEVHLVDQRNHGKSFHHHEHNYSIMSDDLNKYMDFHKIAKAHIIGHSMGGKAAMFFSNIYNEKLEKLIVVDISPKFYPVHHQAYIDIYKNLNLEEFSTRKEIESVFEKDNVPTPISLFLMKNIYRDGNNYKLKINIDSISRNIDNVGVKFEPNKKIVNPSLFIKGELSNYISQEDINMIKSIYTNSKIEEISNSGHWVHADNPKIFLNSVKNFLDEK